MEAVILFIKTYRKDFEQCKKLLQSIEKYNRDNIKTLISVNDSDFQYFQYNLSSQDFQIIKDSDIVECKVTDAWRYQQVVKSQLHRLKICDNYVCIDSDGFFIKDFFKNDFLVTDSIPYTIIHQQKELFNWLSINEKLFKNSPKTYFEAISVKIMEQVGRKGICYDFGPSPTIWSCKIWQSFEQNYLKVKNIDYQQLIQDFPSEFTWYGEWMLHSKEIPLFPKEPLFKVFHYKKQYQDFIKEGHSLESIRKNYLGIVIQSNWLRKQRWYHRTLKF